MQSGRSVQLSTNTFTSLRAACEAHPAGENNVYSANTPDVFLTKLNPSGTQILYSTFFGGSGNENPNGIGLDAQGNIYIVGNTSSVSAAKDVYPPGGSVPYPVTGTALQSAATSSFYGFVAFLTKFSPDAHTVLYSTILGSWSTSPCPGNSCGNIATSLAVGSNGLVTIGGSTNSPQLPVTRNALQSSCVTGANGFCAQTGYLATFDTTKSGAASLAYATYLNGTSPAQSTSAVQGVAMDAQGNVYATGATTAANFPTTPGTLSPACTPRGAGNCYGAFISKLTPAGALAWSTYYESKVSCCTVTGSAIAVDAGQNVYVAGGNGGAYDLPLLDAFQAGEKGFQDAFLVALNPSGSQLLFGSYFGGSSDDIVTSLALDASRNIYLGGYTTSSDLPVTPGAFQMTSPSAYQQGFALKIAPVPVASPPSISAAGDRQRRCIRWIRLGGPRLVDRNLRHQSVSCHAPLGHGGFQRRKCAYLAGRRASDCGRTGGFRRLHQPRPSERVDSLDRSAWADLHYDHECGGNECLFSHYPEPGSTRLLGAPLDTGGWQAISRGPVSGWPDIRSACRRDCGARFTTGEARRYADLLRSGLRAGHARDQRWHDRLSAELSGVAPADPVREYAGEDHL